MTPLSTKCGPFCRNCTGYECELEQKETWDETEHALISIFAIHKTDDPDDVIRAEMGAVLEVFRVRIAKEARNSELNRIRTLIEGMRKKTCDCNEDPGFHSKECDFTPFGFNQALNDLLKELDTHHES